MPLTRNTKFGSQHLEIFHMKKLVLYISIIGLVVLQGSMKWMQQINGAGNVIVHGNHDTVYITGNMSNPPPTSPKFVPICSELKLPIPDESLLLQRPHLIKKITNKFAKSKGITTVALVGLGGSGKTTLARQIGRLHKHTNLYTVVWEINAQNSAYKRSFQELASALAQTSQQKSDLSFIEHLPNETEREKQRLIFVQERLRAVSGWFLIFDNVESLAKISKYLPQDHNIWGRGQIIITTQNNHIKNSDALHYDNIIEMEALTVDEMLILFSKSRFHQTPETLPAIEQNAIRDFLTHISPLPLDVSIAATYLSVHQHLSYADYIKELIDQRREFYTEQKAILEECSTYTQSRYSLIAVSIEPIIKSHKVFSELLLLITLLDYKQISRDLLELHSTKQIVKQFLHQLKKYALISAESTDGSTFSIHQRILEMIQAYLKRTLQITPHHPSVLAVNQTIISYIQTVIDNSDHTKLMWLKSHCKQLLYNALFSDTTKSQICVLLGCIYYELGNDMQAKEYLERGLLHLNNNKDKHAAVIAQALTYLGSVYRRWGMLDKAKESLEKSIDIRNHTPSSNLLDYIYTYALLGRLYIDIANFDKAGSALKKGAEIAQSYSNKLSPIKQASLSLYTGMLYICLGQYEKAKELIEKSLASYNNSQHPGFKALALISLSKIYKGRGDYIKAKELIEHSIDILRNNNLDYHPNYMWGLVLLGELYKKLGNYKEAEKWIKKGIEHYRKYSMHNKVTYYWSLSHLGMLQRKLGLFQNANDMLEECKKNYIEIFGKNSLKTQWILEVLGQLYVDTGEYSQAKKLYESCLVIYQKDLDAHHPKLGKVLVNLGYIYHKLGSHLKAKELLGKGITIYNLHYDKEHLRMAQVLRYFGEIHSEGDDLEKAEESIKTSLKILEKNNHPEIHWSLESLAELYQHKTQRAQGNAAQQKYHHQRIQYLQKALTKAEEHFPKGSAHIMRIKRSLEEANAKRI